MWFWYLLLSNRSLSFCNTSPQFCTPSQIELLGLLAVIRNRLKYPCTEGKKPFSKSLLKLEYTKKNLCRLLYVSLLVWGQ